MVSKVSQLSIIRKASRWNKRKVTWHFHLLSPGCLFNPTKQHELFLESRFGAFVSKSKSPLGKIARNLVNLLDVRRTKLVATTHAAVFSKILKRGEQLTAKKIKWHYHLLFPLCTFNNRVTKWVIVFEDTLENKLTEVVYPHYPAADLKKLEKLFYSQKPSHSKKR